MNNKALNRVVFSMCALAAAMTAAPALADDALAPESGFYALAGAATLYPNAHELPNKTQPTVGLGYAFTPNWSLEADAAVGRYREHVSLPGVGRVAAFRARPLEVSGLYHFTGLGLLDDNLQPYVGVGYAWSQVGSERGHGPLEGVPVSFGNANGPLARLGVDYRINRNWFARADATYLDASSRATIDGLSSPSLAANAWQYGLQIGYAF